jgi:hypothetical protein
VPLHTPNRIVPVVAAAACIAAGAATVATAEPSRPTTTPYFDIEANKAASMRALGLHIAAQRAEPGSSYQDLEANKALSRRAR